MNQKNKKKKKESALWRRLIMAVLGVILGVNAYLANARGLGGQSTADALRYRCRRGAVRQYGTHAGN
ncbi:hypothetical protein [Frisingicoccus sp.]|uniref:hypothetical protein n=1 Tax=Frisingicoccus sp. TaxID=1918627 RepID=UPI003AB43D3E